MLTGSAKECSCRANYRKRASNPECTKGQSMVCQSSSRNEGVRGIYRGLGAAYVYQVLLNGCRLGFYEPIRHTLTSALFTDATTQSLGINVFAGATSGILGAAAGSPFFLVKTRLQSFSPFAPVGTQHAYKGRRGWLESDIQGRGRYWAL